jgi:LemA protein
VGAAAVVAAVAEAAVAEAPGKPCTITSRRNSMTLIIILVVVAALVLFGVVAFNKLRRVDISAQEALGGVDVQLTRRADLIPNLVNTVKGYAQHERAVFDEVTKARAGVSEAAKSGSIQEKVAAEARLDKALVDVLAVAEAYPDLKASANFQELQAALADTENQLSFSRQFYNDAVKTLNSLVKTIPWLFFTGIAGVHEREFYDAPEGQEAPPAVQF